MIRMTFASREDAGKRLGQWLRDKAVQVDLVLGLPRGGVVVAAEVAHFLNLPLDVLIVRKIGHPLHREFALGALAEGDVVILDDALIGNNPIIRSELREIIEEEKKRLADYQSRFHHHALSLSGKRVVLVDDGLATRATTQD